MVLGPRAILLAIAAASGAVLLVTFGVAWPLAVLVVNVGCAALWWIDVRRTIDPSSLVIEREAPKVASITQPFEVALTVANPGSYACKVTVRDATPASAGRSPLMHALRVPAKGRADVLATLTPTRRGWLRLGPMTVRVLGPLGIGGRQRLIEQPAAAAVKVYPALPGRRVVEERITIARVLHSGMHSSALHGGGTTFDALREYHTDDEFRRLNWRATARARAPIVNVFREEQDQQVLLLLDASRMMAGSIDGISRFELAIDAANTVGELASRVGDRVGMVSFADGPLSAVATRGGRNQSRIILDALFDVEPRLEAPDYAGAFGGALTRNRRRSLLVLLTELTAPEAMESLFRALPILVRRHLVVVGSVLDPALEEAGRAEPRDAEGAYRKAAAANLLLARTRAARRLRAQGAIVEDRPPAALAAALADAYLRIKGAGRL